MTVVDKANELGMMLKESSEYVRLQKAQAGSAERHGRSASFNELQQKKRGAC